MDGATIRDANGEPYVIEKIVARLQRGDGHQATAYLGQDGGFWIRGGCQFLSLADFRAKADRYTDVDRRAETHNILNFIEAEAIRQGALKPAKKAPAKK